MSQDPIPAKLVIVGDGCVGKTCVLISYTTDTFPTDYVPTVFENYAATVKVDGTMVNLGLWDTAGQEEYNKLRPLAYPNCDVFLLTFSVVDPATFVNARKKVHMEAMQWYPELNEACPNVPKIFIGNKIDLRNEARSKNKDPKNAPIEKETAKRIIEDEFKCRYFECSALTQDGLKEIFDEAMRMVIRKKVPGAANKKIVKHEGADESNSCKMCTLI